MDNIKYLYKQNYLKFEEMLLEHFLKLRLSEQELSILQLLYRYELYDSNQLSLTDLANHTTLSVEALGEEIDLLVKKGFVELTVSEETGMMEELFSVFPTVVRLLEELNKPILKDESKEIVMMLEQELGTPLSSKELILIKAWTYSLEEVKAALLQAHKQGKVSIPYMDKILENKKKEVVKDMSYFDQFLNN